MIWFGMRIAIIMIMMDNIRVMIQQAIMKTACVISHLLILVNIERWSFSTAIQPRQYTNFRDSNFNREEANLKVKCCKLGERILNSLRISVRFSKCAPFYADAGGLGHSTGKPSTLRM